jgi:hypothetical protein
MGQRSRPLPVALKVASLPGQTDFMKAEPLDQ